MTNCYVIDKDHSFNLSENYRYLSQHKHTIISKNDNTISVAYRKEIDIASAGFRLKLSTKPEESYVLRLSAELVTGDKAFVYCESDTNIRLIPRIYYLHGDTHKQSYILHFIAETELTYVGILFYQKDIDYTLALYDLIIEQSECPDYIGPIFDHLLPDRMEILRILDQPAKPIMEMTSNDKNESNDKKHIHNARNQNNDNTTNIRSHGITDGVFNDVIDIWKPEMSVYDKYAYLVYQFKQYILTHNLLPSSSKGSYYDGRRLVVTIGTELDDPDRLKNVIMSLQDQLILPEAIYVNIPYNFSRNAKTIPEWLLELHNMTNSNVSSKVPIIINRCPNYGSLTGLYGYLPISDNNQTKICVIPDTKICPRNYLSELMLQFREKNAVITANNARIVTGSSIINLISLSGGFLISKEFCRDDIKELIRIIEANPNLNTNKDDIYEVILSIYISAKNLIIKSISSNSTYNLDSNILDMVRIYFEKAYILSNKGDGGDLDLEPRHHIFMNNKTDNTDNRDKLLNNNINNNINNNNNNINVNDGKKVAVIVEPRKDSILLNVVEHYRTILDESWLIQIFHGHDNKKMILDSKLKDWIKEGKIKLTLLNVHNLSRLNYSKMLLTKEFYNKIDGDNILIFQTDTCLCQKRSEYTLEDFLEYDYVGAPWDKKTGPKSLLDPKKKLFIGNGGISFRKKQTMIKICRMLAQDKYKHLYRYNEDQVISSFLLERNLFPDVKNPSYDMAKKFAIECVYTEGTLAVHKPWKYLKTKDLNRLRAECPEMVRLFKGKYFR